jgi:hypothetical protein
MYFISAEIIFNFSSEDYIEKISSCHPVILLSCYPVILLSCHPVILLSCYPVILSSCYPVILSSCYPVILLSCHPVILFILIFFTAPFLYIIMKKSDFIERKKNCSVIHCLFVVGFYALANSPYSTFIILIRNNIYNKYSDYHLCLTCKVK